MNSAKEYLKTFSYPLLSATLLSLAFPLALSTKQLNDHFVFALFGWLALVPLFYSLKPKKLLNNFFKGFIFGFFSNWLILYWITHSMIVFGGLNLLTSILVLNLLIIYLSLYPATWCLLIKKFETNYCFPFVAAAIWVLLEYVKTYLMTGFPWCNIGYTQGNLLIFCQIADIFGSYGLGFVIVAVNLLIAMLIRPTPAISRVRIGVTLAILVFSTLLYGSYRLNETGESQETISISSVQGNIPQDIKWQRGKRAWIMKKYIALTTPLTGNTDVVVWPEASFPYPIERGRKNVPALAMPISTESDSYLIFGAPTFTHGAPEVFNSALLTDMEGQILDRYDKIHLVLYGEFVPFSNWHPVKKLTKTVGQFESGKEILNFAVKNRFGNWNLGPLICYEVIYPELARTQAANGADIFVNITNDAWFGELSGPYQHLNLARFRSIETRRPMVRVANTGISTAFSSTGRTQDMIPLNQTGTLTADFPRMNRHSTYTRVGDWPLILLIILVIANRPKKID